MPSSLNIDLRFLVGKDRCAQKGCFKILPKKAGNNVRFVLSYFTLLGLNSFSGSSSNFGEQKDEEWIEPAIHPPYPWRIHSKIPSGCLKLQSVPNRAL